jgi:hypothetical protein
MYQGMDCVRATAEEEETLAGAKVVAIGLLFPLSRTFFAWKKASKR